MKQSHSQVQREGTLHWSTGVCVQLGADSTGDADSAEDKTCDSEENQKSPGKSAKQCIAEETFFGINLSNH
jgi:hypothetical protein